MWRPVPCHNSAMAARSNRRANVTRLIAAALVVAAGLGALSIAEGAGKYNTYAGSSIPAAAVAVAAGFALLAAGLIVSFTRPEGRIGDLAILAAFLWFA